MCAEQSYVTVEFLYNGQMLSTVISTTKWVWQWSVEWMARRRKFRRPSENKYDKIPWRNNVPIHLPLLPAESEFTLLLSHSKVIFQGKVQVLSKPWGTWLARVCVQHHRIRNENVVRTSPLKVGTVARSLARSLAQRCVADFSGRKDSDSLFTADQRT